jgi:hypothetical protein
MFKLEMYGQKLCQFRGTANKVTGAMQVPAQDLVCFRQKGDQ